MNNIIPLTKPQKDIMSEFYSANKTKVIYTKSERSELWRRATKRSKEFNFEKLGENCPALAHQIKRSYETGNNIQSAVFSECVYAQTFANMLNLNKFVNCYEVIDFIPHQIRDLLASYYLTPRYVYSTEDKSRMLIQAGGCNGIDSALITVIDLQIYTIEFKEPGAKTSEPDLPKYGEDGNLLVTEDFLSRYPQFKEMLSEQQGLNFFERMGSNIHDFSEKSINIAVSNNYTKKYADVVCTEDASGYLVMLPINQISTWAEIEGEIRPAGRNHYKVWTPKALTNFLIQKQATFENERVFIPISSLNARKQRGGSGKISGYKINSLFFIYKEDCKVIGETVSFDISKVQQLNPTIAGKMFFKALDYEEVSKYYKNLF